MGDGGGLMRKFCFFLRNFMELSHSWVGNFPSVVQKHPYFMKRKVSLLSQKLKPAIFCISLIHTSAVLDHC